MFALSGRFPIMCPFHIFLRKASGLKRTAQVMCKTLCAMCCVSGTSSSAVEPDHRCRFNATSLASWILVSRCNHCSSTKHPTATAVVPCAILKLRNIECSACAQCTLQHCSCSIHNAIGYCSCTSMRHYNYCSCITHDASTASAQYTSQSLHLHSSHYYQQCCTIHIANTEIAQH